MKYYRINFQDAQGAEYWEIISANGETGALAKLAKIAPDAVIESAQVLPRDASPGCENPRVFEMCDPAGDHIHYDACTAENETTARDFFKSLHPDFNFSDFIVLEVSA